MSTLRPRAALLRLLCAALLGGLLAGAAWAQNPLVELRTSLGVIVLELEPKAAPDTVRNFLEYVKDGHYDGTIFHRVIPDFMIQGGGLTPDLKEKPTRPPIRSEAERSLKAGLRNEIGTVAMARTSNPHSATAQFFINVARNDFLDYREPTAIGFGYTVFGRVVKGLEVVNRIRLVPTTKKPPHEHLPEPPVVIERALIVRGGARK
jgi:cyclophilin family peptidyl-prolyl cis-trans isomerase